MCIPPLEDPNQAYWNDLNARLWDTAEKRGIADRAFWEPIAGQEALNQTHRRDVAAAKLLAVCCELAEAVARRKEKKQ